MFRPATAPGRLQVPPIGSKPHQPSSFKFPKREFGKKAVVKRSFLPHWFQRWPWLHYSEDKDAVFCFVCVKAYSEKKLDSIGTLESTYISSGYTNWKDACVKFPNHEMSRCHKDAVLKTVTLPATTQNVGELLSSELAKERLERRQCFLKLLSNVRFLSRQGLPLRGAGDESDSNYMQLLLLRAEDDPRIFEWLRKKTDKYTSGDMQNEMMKVMAQLVLDEVKISLYKSPFWTIMVDETTDSSNREQVVICMRWVGEDFNVHEDFIGLFMVDSIDADTIFAVIIDVLRRLNLSITKIRGQCYDGAATMSGKRSGVATKVLQEEPKAIYTHCYGHSLNLACGDAVKQCKVMRDSLDTTHEITKLIKKSPRRDALLQKLKTELAPDTPSLRALCPTRWTVRADALKSILNNYEVLQELWEESLDIVKETDMKARINGVASQMQKFDFFYGVSLGDLILRHSDNLSKTLQKSDISAAEGQDVASMTLKTLESLRSDSNFKLFWQKICKEAESLDISQPCLPRRRKVPRRLEEGEGEGTFAATTEDYYRQIYFEALDLIVTKITDRFDQPGYKVYSNVQNLILKAAQGKDYKVEFDHVTKFYASDFNPDLLKTQLETFTANFTDQDTRITLADVTEFFRSKTSAQRSLLSEACKLFQLLLVMPATNAVSERSFSALRRVKSYLRSTMKQDRLNHIMTLHIHRNLTDKLNYIDIANQFIFSNEHRQNIFGKFISTDTN